MLFKNIEFFLWGSLSGEAAEDQQLQVFCFIPELVIVSSGHWALFPNEQAGSGGQLDGTAPIHQPDMEYRTPEPHLPMASRHGAYFR